MHHTRPHNYANIRVQSEQCTALHKKPHNIAGQSLNFQNQLFIHVYFVICTCVCTHYYKHQWTFLLGDNLIMNVGNVQKLFLQFVHLHWHMFMCRGVNARVPTVDNLDFRTNFSPKRTPSMYFCCSRKTYKANCQ